MNDESLINVIDEKLHQFTRNNAWELVSRLENYNVIGTKWIFKNKSNKHGTIIRNKTRLVAQNKLI